VRIFRHHPVRLARALIAVSILAAAAGCGGGSGNSLPGSGNGQLCDSNAGSITIARPTNGFPSNGNTIEIVSSSSTDDLHGNPGAFDLFLNNNSNVTSTLSLVADPNGPHPYTTDFFYQASLPAGLSGTYNVFLNVPNSTCQPGFIGTVSF
jgi:hypothetical protein